MALGMKYVTFETTSLVLIKLQLRTALMWQLGKLSALGVNSHHSVQGCRVLYVGCSFEESAICVQVFFFFYFNMQNTFMLLVALCC
jgi:hypothetical protein